MASLMSMATPNDIAPLEDFDDDDDTEGKRDDRGDDCDWEVNIRDACGRDGNEDGNEWEVRCKNICKE